VQFLAPVFLAGAAIVALPIVLHLLRRDVAPRVPFPAVRLLRGTPLERSRSRRLRDLLLLAARVTALLLLAASFARPYRAGATGTAPLTIVAVDRSYSMGAPGRFARALDIARAEIDRASGGRVAVVAFDDRAAVIAPPGTAPDARAALAGLTAGTGSTRYAAVFDRAAELAGVDAGARLVVVSDLQRSGLDAWPASLPEDIDLQPRPVERGGTNLAISDVEVRDWGAHVTVRNYGEAGAATTLRVGPAAKPVFTRAVEIAPKASAIVDVPAISSGPLTATIDDPGGYPADNDRYAVVDAATRPAVLVVTGGPGSTDGFYFARALQAADDAGAEFEVRTVTGPEFADLTPADVSRAAAVVVLSTHAIQRRAGEQLKALFAAGGGVFAAAGNDVDPEVLSDVLGLETALRADEDTRRGVLAVSNVRHPVFRPFSALSANLAHVGFERTWRVGSNPSWTTIAAFSTGAPALLERSIGRGRVLLFASDVDRRWNDFPLHASFVPFVQEAIRYVSARRPATGALLVSDVPDDVPATPGVATIDGRLRAVNVDSRESAIETMSPAEFVAAVTRTSGARPAAEQRRAREREAAQGLWRYGLGLLLLTLGVEAFVAAR
jgi:hypothetical protein